MSFNLPEQLTFSLLGIFTLLVFASGFIWFLKLKNPEKNYTELVSRVKTWWIMSAVFSAAMVMNRGISIVFFALISFLALKEYLSLIPTRRADRRVIALAYASIPLQYYWVLSGWYGMFIIFIPVYMFLLLPFRAVIIGATEGYLTALSTLHWGLMITVFSISHVAFLMVLPGTAASANPSIVVDAGVSGPGLVLFLVVLTQLNDVAQYVWGKSFGKHRIIPLVSPNKTWEGFFGGVFTTTVLAAILHAFLTPMTLFQSIVAGVLIAVSGFVGDVTISAIKRDLKIKDSGNLLPGHGGILDRIDSLTYTAPLFFHYVRYLCF